MYCDTCDHYSNTIFDDSQKTTQGQAKQHELASEQRPLSASNGMSVPLTSKIIPLLRMISTHQQDYPTTQNDFHSPARLSHNSE